MNKPITPETRSELAEGIKFVGQQLRKWSDLHHFKQMTVTMETADTDVVIRVDEARHVWLNDLELTAIVDGNVTGINPQTP